MEVSGGVPRLLGRSDILKSLETVLELEARLPKTLQTGYNWKLLYSVQQHGSNFGTFFLRCAQDPQTLLFAENARGEVFGFFATAAYRSTGEYYGTGESFLFALQKPDDEAELLKSAFGGDDENDKVDVVRAIAPSEEAKKQKKVASGAILEGSDDNSSDDKERSQESHDERRKKKKRVPKHSVRGAIVDVFRSEDPETLFTKARLQVYPWTGENSYFMMCTDHSLAMGGGGEWGLFIDDHFARGATGRCNTYGNKNLCQDTDFDIVNLEVWGFTTATSLDDDNNHKKAATLSQLVVSLPFLLTCSFFSSGADRGLPSPPTSHHPRGEYMKNESSFLSSEARVLTCFMSGVSSAGLLITQSRTLLNRAWGSSI